MRNTDFLVIGSVAFLYFLIGCATGKWKVVITSFVWLVGGGAIFILIAKISIVLGVFYMIAWATFPVRMILRGFRDK